MVEQADLLLEIGTEELPPKALRGLRDALAEGLQASLATLGVRPRAVERFATPRRLAVRLRGLPTVEPSGETLKRGPALAAAFDADGAPTRALLGFARSIGVQPDELERLETDKGTWLAYRVQTGGRPLGPLLVACAAQALAQLPIPRPMRWGAGETAFVRPVHWALMRFGEQMLEGELLGVTIGPSSRGHRFHHPEAVTIDTPAEYEARLRAAWVEPDLDRREAQIQAQVERAAADCGGQPVSSPALVAEVAGLVEWPVPVTGSFDARYLELPEAVLIATLQGHQRYFPVRGEQGLLAHFITFSNIDSREPARVQAGNERVIRPRLADAEFFYRQDMKTPLAQLLPRLEAVVFQRRLGSLADKSRRVERLARLLAPAVGAESASASRAADLAKADLLTAMVGEFPELQGVMGCAYALAQDEPPTVAHALREQYLPQQAGDPIPTTATGRALALAERLDTLAGIFAIDARPSGDKDPFALRRAALGIVRICVEAELDLDLPALLREATALQPVDADATLAATLYEFVIERARSYLAERGHAGAAIDAAIAREPASLLDLERRVRAAEGFLATAEWDALASAHKRSRNILRKSPAPAGHDLAPTQLVEPAERALYARLEQLQPRLAEHLERHEYPQAFQVLAELRGPVDAFFDEVMVLAEDPALRANRLQLLGRLQTLLGSVVDLGRLQG